MIYKDGRACSVCKRRYAHLTGCSVPALHDALDEMIKRVGIDMVMVVNGTGGKLKGFGAVVTSVEVHADCVVRGRANTKELEVAMGGPLPEG